MKGLASVIAAAMTLGLGSAAVAEPTDVTVRVLSRGAKFVGTSMGGARVTLRDADTDELLAEGVTHGGTGDTQRIMGETGGRHAVIATEDAARYTTTLDLDRPRRIEVTAAGPLAQPQAINTVSATQWVVPGRDLTGGNGWVLELPGFAVDVLAPAAHVTYSGVPRTVPLRANVVLMCGCPVTPGGLWDANRYAVTALLYRDGERVRDVPLNYAGETSRFETSLRLERPGSYEAVVVAHDPHTGNTGLDRVTFQIAR